MAINQTGIAIVIKAFLPIGKTIDETYEALSLVKTAHETGDYSKVLAAASIDEIKAEQKTRRIEVEFVPEAEQEPEVVPEAEAEIHDPTDPADRMYENEIAE